MPATTQTPIRAYAHCTNPRCSGHDQEEVDALQVETAFTFAENGGDLPGIERSSVSLIWADPEQSACQACGRNRDLSDAPRKRYENLSGADPNGLLEMQAQGIEFDPRRQIEIRQEPLADPERERLEAENAGLRDLLAAQGESIARLEGYMMGQQAPAQEAEEER